MKPDTIPFCVGETFYIDISFDDPSAHVICEIRNYAGEPIIVENMPDGSGRLFSAKRVFHTREQAVCAGIEATKIHLTKIVKEIDALDARKMALQDDLARLEGEITETSHPVGDATNDRTIESGIVYVVEHDYIVQEREIVSRVTPERVTETTFPDSLTANTETWYARKEDIFQTREDALKECIHRLRVDEGSHSEMVRLGESTESRSEVRRRLARELGQQRLGRNF